MHAYDDYADCDNFGYYPSTYVPPVFKGHEEKHYLPVSKIKDIYKNIEEYSESTEFNEFFSVLEEICDMFRCDAYSGKFSFNTFYTLLYRFELAKDSDYRIIDKDKVEYTISSHIEEMNKLQELMKKVNDYMPKHYAYIESIKKQAKID